MRYVTLMYTDPDHTKAMARPEFDAILRKHAAFREDLTASGELVGGAGLALPDETTLLRLGTDGVVAAQGPFATDEVHHVTGYYEIECDTPARASEIAERLLDNHVVAVELRRIHSTTDV